MLLLAGLVLCGAGLWLLLRPAQYQATVRMESEPTDTGWPNASTMTYDPYFIQTEFEVIQSQVVLGKVVESLNLNVEWGKKYGTGSPLKATETIALLKQRMSLSLVKNTKLIEISFHSEDPNEAAGIASAIAKAYQDYRMEMRRQMTLEGIKVLTASLQEEQHSIEAKQEKLEQLRKQLNMPNPEPAEELLKSNYPSYFQAKRGLQNMIEFHKLIAAKNESEKLDVKIPKPSMVEIVNIAEPPKFPVSPSRSLGAALLAIGLFPTVGGFLFLKSSRRQSA